jgi:hypothetical protein
MTLPLTGAGPSGGGFDPLSLTPDFWFKADAITGKNDADAVGSWTDSSGNSRTATQGTGTRQPLYKTNVVNGKPVLRFDGVDDNLAIPAYSHGDVFSVFAVVESTALTAAHVVVGDTSHFRFVFKDQTGNAIQLDTNDTTFRFKNAALNAFHYVSAVRAASTTAQVWADGATDGSNAVGVVAASSEGLSIGMNPAFNSFLTGDIAEIIYYPTALSSTNRAAVETYLKAKYGL